MRRQLIRQDQVKYLRHLLFDVLLNLARHQIGRGGEEQRHPGRVRELQREALDYRKCRGVPFTARVPKHFGLEPTIRREAVLVEDQQVLVVF